MTFTHEYMASDKPLSSLPIISSNEAKKPDIMALKICDNPILVSEAKTLPLAAIVVIEIKRPMRDDAKAGESDDPLEQVLGYLERIRNGGVKTASGRQIPKSEGIPGFCYVICDITPTISRRCRLMGLTPTQDQLGYFGYNANYRSYLEVSSYDLLLRAANERNRAFFDKLGLPTT